MAEPRTQDNQKVFNSSLANFQSFINGVKSPSSSKNMSIIYNNMEMLFDTFTQGALLGQGANSEILLRTIYRSLNDDFLTIFQDTEAIDRIIEELKKRQESVATIVEGSQSQNSEDKQKSEEELTYVSETVKKVVTKTLDPIDCDIQQVVLDFIDEVQTAILKVRRNLTREYEKQKLDYQKLYKNQQSDIESLNKGVGEQGQKLIDELPSIQERDLEWKREKLEQTQKLIDTFNTIDGNGGKHDLPSDGEIKDIQKQVDQIRQYEPKPSVEQPDRYETHSSNKDDDVHKQDNGAVDENPTRNIQSKHFNPKRIIRTIKSRLVRNVVKPTKEIVRKNNITTVDEKPTPPVGQVREVPKTEPNESAVVRKDEQHTYGKKEPEERKIEENRKEITVVRQIEQISDESDKSVHPTGAYEDELEVGRGEVRHQRDEITVVDGDKQQEQKQQIVVEDNTVVERQQQPTVEPGTSSTESSFRGEDGIKQVEKPVSQEQETVVDKPSNVEEEESSTQSGEREQSIVKTEVDDSDESVVEPQVDNVQQQQVLPKTDIPKFEPSRDIEKLEQAVSPQIVEDKQLIDTLESKRTNVSRIDNGHEEKNTTVEVPKLSPQVEPIVKKEHQPVEIEQFEQIVVEEHNKVEQTTDEEKTDVSDKQKSGKEKDNVAKQPSVDTSDAVDERIEEEHKQETHGSKLVDVTNVAQEQDDAPKTEVPKFEIKELDRLNKPAKTDDFDNFKEQIKKEGIGKGNQPATPVNEGQTKQKTEKDTDGVSEMETHEIVDTVVVVNEGDVSKQSKNKQVGKKQEESKDRKIEKSSDVGLIDKAKPHKTVEKNNKLAKKRETLTDVESIAKPEDKKESSGNSIVEKTKNTEKDGKKKEEKTSKQKTEAVGTENETQLVDKLISPIEDLNQIDTNVPKRKDDGQTSNNGKDNVRQDDNGKQETSGTKIQVQPKPMSIPSQNKGGANDKESNQNQKEDDSKNTKLVKKPTISNPLQKKQEDNKQQNNSVENDISSAKVKENLGRLNQNITDLIQDKKFQSSFVLGYPAIQSNVQKQMGKMDKDEETISKDLAATQKGINNLKKKKKKGSLLSMLFSPANLIKIAFITIGGLILITLVRMALKKWKDTYMPKTDGKTDTIFGIPIPGLATIKALGLGIWNFVTVGLPNMWDKLKAFWKPLKRKLFGKKGMFSTATESINTIRKIFIALIIGWTKKATGMFFKILGWCLFWLPGGKQVCDFLSVLVPQLYSFISTQIMLLWSNKKADSEQRFKDLQKNLTSASMQGKLIQSGAKVKSFAPPSAIPGLETPKKGTAKQGHRGAIMRRIDFKTVGNTKRAQEIQEKQLEEDQKKGEEQDEKRFGDKKTAGVLINKLSAGAAVQKEDYQYGGMQKRMERIKRTYEQTIMPQIKSIDNYISTLKQSKRFVGVKGELYNPNTGWNPGYRVLQSDLMSPIPLTPFEEFHQKADVKIGEPSRGDESYIGIMPFTWLQNGVQISAHPINYEIARASKIRKVWLDLMKDISSPYFWSGNYANEEDIRKDLLPKHAKDWREANYITQGGYGKDVLYGDKFEKFLKEFRAGNIDHDTNNMEKADDLMKMNKYAKAALIGAAVGTFVPFVGPIGVAIAGMAFVAAQDLTKFAKKAIGKKVDIAKNTLTYDNRRTDTKKEGGGVWGWIKAKAKNALHAGNSALQLKKWRGIKFGGIKYGWVRDFMIENGILDMFRNPTILAPINKANTLVKYLMKDKILLKGTDEKDAPYLHHLIWNHMMHEHIAGYTWEKMSTDKTAQAGFAQSLLEYFGINIIPQWNNVEKLLRYVISNDGDKSPRLILAIKRLLGFFNQEAILSHLAKYIRFPNIKTRLVNYSNATRAERKQIEAYRKKLGIPNEKEKNAILKRLSGEKPETYHDWARKAGDIAAQLDKARMEARATGDYTYVRQLEAQKKEANRMATKLLNEELAAKKGGNKLISKPGVIGKETIQKVVPPPQKSEEEIRKEEEERKRKEEEERKKKEEAEKKRLAEEAKRKEELVVAQAKIAAMEAIRKQEQNYETILEKMVGTPDKVTDAELKSLGEDVSKLKQEAENRIAQLPREEREMKLALIRGDKVSPKTFTELKETAVGLHGSLRDYIKEVDKIPVGSVMAVQNTATGKGTMLPASDADSVDMGD